MATTDNTQNPNLNNNLPQEENPTKTLDPTEPKPDLGLSEQPTPDPTADKDAAADESMVSPATAPISDAQKKKIRAERFGITVQLSEKDKRNSRAERFGTSSTTPGSETSKSEEVKRKARAERFGIPSPTTTADEKAKKKARVARFAPASKAAADPAEEDKRKARALRFSNQSSGSLSQVNSKGNVEPVVIAGKAVGGD
ncbi:hypothetical protein TanjilG_06235 [Lupinus angustifolius]|uniref:THO1-MOS11 C-terminal domain-containing protein n=1 Tax=Lupinus angustifolius TaxID=3871 RepID=A0A1J7HX58_LUPAN|nr:PREDICTED: protein MODIFIER OF SNC1 11-like isoform X2 [Lupinus angustifolius]OIW05099.1 hypothetical protein TanjilG_06235 [Lupinus angustifolius]